MVDPAPSLTPNQELAALTAKALAEAGLVLPEREADLQQQLAAGTMKEQDWRVLIETALPKPDGEDADGPGD